MENNELIEYSKKPLQTKTGPSIEITCCSNIYIRRMTFFLANIIELGHTHEYDHISYVSSGSVEVQVYDDNNKEMAPPKIYKAPATIFIAKNLVHQIKSLEDNTVVSCIHALRDIEGEIIDPSMYPGPTSLYDAIGSYKTTNDNELKSPVLDDKFNNFRFPRPFNPNNFF
jgi:hypothetical protein